MGRPVSAELAGEGLLLVGGHLTFLLRLRRIQSHDPKSRGTRDDSENLRKAGRERNPGWEGT